MPRGSGTLLIGLRGRPWVSFNLEASAHHPQAQSTHGVFCVALPQDWFLMTHPPVTGAPSWGGRGPLSQTFPRARDGGDPRLCAPKSKLQTKTLLDMAVFSYL